MKDILLPTIGTGGDVYPFIAIGAELKRRGHRVSLIANEHFQSAAQQAGIDFIQLAPVERYQAALNNPDLWNPKRGANLLATSVFAAMRDTYHIIADFNPATTQVVASGLMFGARIAQEKLKFRLTTIHLQPALFWSLQQPPIMAALQFPDWVPGAVKRGALRLVDRVVLDKLLAARTNEFRAELGLSPVRHLYSQWLRSPEQVIGLFPEWFAAPQSDWPKQTVLTGFVRGLGAQQDLTLPQELLEFLADGAPPVVFTAGTGMLHGENFFEQSVKACALLGKRGVFITPFREQLPSKLPSIIHHCDYASFSELFPRAAAVVHHGGIGTLAEALAAKIPQIIQPTAHDQPDNAARLEQLGIAATIKPRNYQAATVARKISALLSSSEVGARCNQYGVRIDFAGALRATCDAITSD
jgi:rhamnosyltransferase subunit B